MTARNARKARSAGRNPRGATTLRRPVDVGTTNGTGAQWQLPSLTEPLHTPWRRKGFGILRILFGVVWSIDAFFKWQPAFHESMDAYLAEGAVGQPAGVQAWIDFWVDIVGVNPHLFGTLLATAETALALALLFGVLTNLAYLGGIVLSLAVWSTAEGFGGPYQPGSADIGAAIIYVLVFVALFLTSAGFYFGLDRYLTPLLGRWGILAAGPVESDQRERRDL